MLSIARSERIANSFGMTRSPGFGVGVFPTGRKVYVAQYRQNGRSRRANLGEHGRLTPDEARSLAKKLLGVVETGADPIEAQPRGARSANLWRSR